MGAQTIGAVLDALGSIAEIAPAFVPQGVQGAIAEQAAEGFWIGTGMAGKILALFVLEEIVMAHGNLFSSPPTYDIISQKERSVCVF